MKLSFILCLSVLISAAVDTTKVLWLGNSLIQSAYSRTDEVNRFCKEKNIPVYNKYGAYQYNLVQGWNSVPANRDNIRSNNWDYVVLEVFSNIGIECTFKDGVPLDTNYFACIRKWDALIDSMGAKTILYLPWGYQSFAPSWDSVKQMWKPDRMDTALMALKTICTEVNAAMFPVGPANFEIQKREPTMRLWLDGTHGSAQGCYLGGLICYAELFGKDPRGLGNLYNLDSQTVYLLQQTAWQTVFRPDMVTFGGLWTRPQTVKAINIYAQGNVSSIEQYLSVNILGDLTFTNDSVVTGSRQMLYRSLTPSVMTVNHFGLAQAKAPGLAKIETRVANVFDTVTLTVTASTALFDSIRITPRVFTSYVTNGYKFTATGYAYKQGQLVAADLTSLVS
ncbi:MAG: hypothetical protein JNL74_09240, partial [Fibrobacteres bacterium]|nr:hypothetical protein [Fibrobacterota bacterium]